MPYYPPPASSGSGDVTGPGSSVSGDVATFSGTTGKIIQDSGKATPSGVIVGDTDTQTLTNKTLTTPKIDQIKNTNGTTSLQIYSGSASNVNYPSTQASLTGNPVFYSAAGSDTNIDIELVGKGTGVARYAGAEIANISSGQTLTNKNLTSGTNTFPTFNQNTTGSAATLTTSRTFRTDLSSTSTASFNGSANVTPGVTGTLAVGNGGTGVTTTAALAAAVGALLFPIGALYTATVSTNPGTLLGFGTWAAYGEGRVLVGKAASGTFATAGSTGGEETHTLTAAESGVPAHTHGFTDNGVYYVGSGGSQAWPFAAGASASLTQSNTTSSNTAANASSAHNNLQPYIVVYIWQRTA